MSKTTKIGPVVLPVLVTPRFGYRNETKPQFAFLKFNASERTYAFACDNSYGSGTFTASDENALIMAHLQGATKRNAVNKKMSNYKSYQYKDFVKSVGAIVRDTKALITQTKNKLGHEKFAFIMFLDLESGRFITDWTEVITHNELSANVHTQFDRITTGRPYYITTPPELTTEILGAASNSSSVGLIVGDYSTTIKSDQSYHNIDRYLNGTTVTDDGSGNVTVNIIGFCNSDEARERIAKMAEEKEAQRKAEEEKARKEREELEKAANEFWNDNDVARVVHKEAIDKKPETLIMDEVNWKYLVRSIMRGKNLMITGAAGTGKTQAVLRAAKALGREVYNIPLGSTQDPRATLIGNTHFNRDEGTYFVDSLFVKAIQTPNAVILLDELSRANPEAWNILMSVLDYGQRYLRLDESPDSDTVKVADGVCFISTANIGTEYTSTRILDRALSDRFQILEMRRLDVDETKNLLSMLYPSQPKANNIISDIYGAILSEYMSGDKLSEAISTRVVLEFADLVSDGFNIPEAAEVSIYPYFDNDGTESERKFVKQIVQKFIPDNGLQTSKDNHFYIPQ